MNSKKLIEADKTYQIKQTSKMAMLKFTKETILMILTGDGANKLEMNFVEELINGGVFTVHFDHKVTILLYKDFASYAVLTFKEDKFKLDRAIHICIGRLMKQLVPGQEN